jgi:hypothetical protein
MTPPLALTDSRLHDLMRAAKALPRCARSEFLQRVAEELAGKSPCAGNLQRSISAAQRDWLDYQRSGQALNGVVAD